jgi:hypothetical protein
MVRDGGGDATGQANGPVRRSVWIDVAFLIVVLGVIIAAAFFRSANRTDRGAPAEAGPAWTAGPAAKRNPWPFAIPGVRDAVKRDLRSLVTAQEMFFADSIHYATDVASLETWARLSLTSGAKIQIVWASQAGWAAVADGGRLGNASCVVRIGPVPDSLRPRTKLQQREGQEGEPRCDGDP